MACPDTSNTDRDSGTLKPTDLIGVLHTEGLGSADEETLAEPSIFLQGDLRPAQEPPKLDRRYEPSREAMLAALRVVLGLPRVIPSSGPGDLPPDAS